MKKFLQLTLFNVQIRINWRWNFETIFFFYSSSNSKIIYNSSLIFLLFVLIFKDQQFHYSSKIEWSSFTVVLKKNILHYFSRFFSRERFDFHSAANLRVASLDSSQKGWKGISVEFPSDFRLVTAMNRSRVYFPSKGVWRSSLLPGVRMFPCKCVSLIPRLAEGVSINVTRGGKRLIEGRNDIVTIKTSVLASIFYNFLFLFFLIRVTSTPVFPSRLTFCSSSFSIPLFRVNFVSTSIYVCVCVCVGVCFSPFPPPLFSILRCNFYLTRIVLCEGI